MRRLGRWVTPRGFPRAKEARPRSAAPGLALLAVALVAAALLYAPTLDRGLVNYDDPWLYTGNFVVQDASIDSLRTIFLDVEVTSPGRWALAPEYLPVRDLSVMLDYAIWGDAYAGFHLTNLLLYLTAIVLVFAMLDGFGLDRTLAGVAVLLWALHPSHAESVAWLSERKGLLAIVFAAAAGATYARFRAGRGAGWLIAATLATVAAVWSKAPAAFAIAALAGLELVLPERRASRRRALAGLGALAIAGGLAFVPVLLMASRAAVVGGESAIPGGRLATALGVHGHYLQLAAMTVPNAVSYAIVSDGASAGQIILGALGLAALAAVAVDLARPRRPGQRRLPRELHAAAVIWVFGWLPVSHLLLPLHMVAVADRYAMFMTLGAALAAAAALVRIPAPRVRRVAIAAVAVLASVRTFDAQSKWGSSILMWERAIESDPANGMSWSLYAEALVSVGRADLAEAAVVEGLRHTSSPRLLHRQAMLRLERGDRAAGLPNPPPGRRGGRGARDGEPRAPRARGRPARRGDRLGPPRGRARSLPRPHPADPRPGRADGRPARRGARRAPRRARARGQRRQPDQPRARPARAPPARRGDPLPRGRGRRPRVRRRRAPPARRRPPAGRARAIV